MGMIMNLLRVSKQEFDNFVAKPSLFEEWAETFYEDDDENDERLLDIDKAWGGILYLLTGVSFVCGSPDDGVALIASSSVHNFLMKTLKWAMVQRITLLLSK